MRKLAVYLAIAIAALSPSAEKAAPKKAGPSPLIEPFALSAGVFADYQLLIQQLSYSPVDETISVNAMSFGASFDATYVAVNASYLMSIGDPFVDLKRDGTIDQAGSDAYAANLKGTKISYIDIQALGKLPLAIGPFTLAPTAGVDYMLCLSKTRNGNDVLATMTAKDVAKLNDFFAVFGATIGINLGAHVVVGLKGLYGINLTPDYPSAGNWGFQGSKIDAGLCLSYKFSAPVKKTPAPQKPAPPKKR